ncbi:MAG: peptidylprolyl isomerase [Candidatus Lernaella stagnicola]|nr:peptidylprolyl isomerase [Candidatus Lernaella stagnicola]
MLKRSQWIISLLIAVAFALPLVACEQGQSTAGPANVQKSGKTIATVGDATITTTDFENILKRIPPFNRRRYADKKGKMELLDKLVEEELFYQEAVRRGKHKDAEFVERIEQIRRGILASMVKKDLYDEDIEVTESDMKQYFESNPDKFKTPETVKVRLILLRVKRNATAEEEAAAKKKADAALTKLKAGSSWEKVVEQYSEDRASKKKGGLLPKVRKGLRGKEFDDVAFTITKKGEISGVFRDKRGFNIIKFEEKTDATLKDFEEVKSTIERRLKQEKLKTKMETTMDQLRSKAAVKIDEDMLDGVQVDAGPDTGAGPAGMPGLPAMGGKKAKKE